MKVRKGLLRRLWTLLARRRGGEAWKNGFKVGRNLGRRETRDEARVEGYRLGRADVDARCEEARKEGRAEGEKAGVAKGLEEGRAIAAVEVEKARKEARRFGIRDAEAEHRPAIELYENLRRLLLGRPGKADRSAPAAEFLGTIYGYDIVFYGADRRFKSEVAILARRPPEPLPSIEPDEARESLAFVPRKATCLGRKVDAPCRPLFEGPRDEYAEAVLRRAGGVHLDRDDASPAPPAEEKDS